MQHHGFRIGGTVLPYGLLLAPMAGVTDAAFRTVCRAHGAEYTVTEMISAKALWYHDKKTAHLARLTDAELPELLGQNDARQLIHITYGQILTARNGDGSLRFRDRLYTAWKQHREAYAARLEKHISRHLDALGCAKLK